ncbi:MAG: homoserine dehydrogenase [Coriobacteriaceae bacterium]|nr:homoserine dehydrogenase [Coriobacteriaceae bacterium]MDD7430296.1 homoserine dehydrogenase [Coriobacteriaceae bacterium]MDO4498513.1 homoserine dehydrogenase [Coriobacteriaceae bacterium]MDY3799786.1 homoserine dehydrogenase [Eggerthellaceae bacterium]MDY4987841.1 homoserine dehydrogenase [Eggerthellaceae bacterium]
MAVKIGLIGTGTVGGGCIEIIQKHKEGFKRHFGIDLELAQVCSLQRERAEEYGVADIFTDNFHDVLENPEIDVVVEVIGGTTFARTVVTEALKAGKHVVTANKALMATYGEEIMKLAAENEREIAFEASVGGGIPIIGPLKHSLIANEISSVIGIVNGTTNYMLTRMGEDGLTYDDALAEAQAKGFAEADPTADVDGLDAAAKIAILSSIAFNSRVTMADVHTEGIRSLSPVDLATAQEMGYCVKLLAIGNRTDAGIDVRVHPAMLPLDHPLATVNGVFNAIYAVGDFVGETMFFGEGAGAGAAASAVMGDVLEVVRHIQAGIKPLVGCTCTDSLPFMKIEDTVQRYYLRCKVVDKPGILAKMASAFSNHGVSVYSMIQRGADEQANTAELVYVTHSAKDSEIMAAIAEMKAMDNVLAEGEEPAVIRLAGK